MNQNHNLSVTADDLVHWDRSIYNTLSQKSISADVKAITKTKQNKK